MKIAICGDIHISRNSSIIRSRGTRFSTRLENCIKSLNWFEETSKKYNCSLEVFLGDTFDTPTLDDEVLTAIKEIKWNDVEKYALVGNHESSVNGLYYNSTKVLEKEGFNVISNCTLKETNVSLIFLPYFIEEDRKSLKELLLMPILNSDKKKVIFSHNDIAGIRYGMYESKTGFTVDEIESNCELYFNGHLHNSEKITNKIINVGNLTGGNFSEDALNHPHHIVILDTNTLTYEFIENPYAFNFYNIEIKKDSDISILNKLKSNAILSIVCEDYLVDKVKEVLKTLNNVVEYRLIVTSSITKDVDKNLITLRGINHLEQFKNFILDVLNDSDVVKEELNEVIK